MDKKYVRVKAPLNDKILFDRKIDSNSNYWLANFKYSRT